MRGLLWFVALLLLMVWGVTLKGCTECEARGGAYVKGALFYECVRKQ